MSYPDISVKEGDGIVTISKEGLRAKRVFVVKDLDMTDPSATLYKALTSGDWNPVDPEFDIPIRMTPHPTIVIPSAWGAYYEGKGDFAENNCFCADVITVKSFDSTKAIVEVEYAPMNAMTQEPSDNGDEAPALLHIGSSVHAMKVFIDYGGNQLVIPYLGAGSGAGTYNIKKQSDDTAIDPNNRIGADVQVPGKLIRFYRREQAPRASDTLEGFVNSVAWAITPDFTADPQTLLCTRVENETRDEGQSYIVMYEFQWIDLLQASDVNYVTPATDPSGGSIQISPWQIYGFYTIPNGAYGHPPSGDDIGPNQTPTDAIPSVYQMYGLVDFNTVLKLTA
jgi:hypothetical protein